MNNFDKEHSLTGNEFLDFLSWCEVQRIDIENDDKENQNDYNDEDNEEIIYKKERKR